MTEYTIGNICKEVQRIQYSIENQDYQDAINRCEQLDLLLCEIENGTHQLNQQEEETVKKITY